MNNSLFSQIVYDCVGENNIYMQITILPYSGLFQLQMTKSLQQKRNVLVQKTKTFLNRSSSTAKFRGSGDIISSLSLSSLEIWTCWANLCGQKGHYCSVVGISLKHQKMPGYWQVLMKHLLNT